MANLPVEEPDALMCARPDLWERWVSNHPAPPGLQRLWPLANLHRLPVVAGIVHELCNFSPSARYITTSERLFLL